MNALTFMRRSFEYVLNPRNMGTIMLAVIVALGALWLSQCNRTKSLKDELNLEKVKTEQNLAAMTEQIRVIKKLNGDMESSRAAYIGSLDDLKKMNSKLYSALSDQKGLIGGLYANMSVLLDSIVSRDDQAVVNEDSTVSIRFETEYSKQDLFNRITGETRFSLVDRKVVPMYTTILGNEMKIGVTYGFRELDDRYEVFAVAKNPVVRFDELDGFLTIKKLSAAPAKKKRWSVGPAVCWGIDAARLRSSVFVGIGVSYGLLRF